MSSKIKCSAKAISNFAGGFDVTVTLDFTTGNEKIQYHIKPAVPPGFNPRILILVVSPEPTEGNEQRHLEYTFHVQEPLPYDSIEIRVGREICRAVIETPDVHG